MVAGLENPYLESNEWGWQIDPVGLENYFELFISKIS